MLTSNISRDANSALEYYQQGLSFDDYYRDGKVDTAFRGMIAKRLGYENLEVTEKRFSSLLHDIDFKSGEKLRIREIENARVGYDFTTNCQKSISLVYSITKDPAILEALNYANERMMQKIESYAQYQEHNKTQRNYKYSKEILYTSYLHRTTRPSEIKDENGKTVYAPDPHLHIHNFINAHTYNNYKQRFQALELGDGVYRRLPYFEKVFHAHLAYELQKAGYHIERTENGFFELAGISRSVIERFSNRTQTIEKFARTKNIIDPKIKSELGAKLRLSKEAATVKQEELADHWASRLSKEELETIQTLKGRKFKAPKPLSLRECLNRAISHHLEREAAAPTERVLATAMTYGYGSYLPDDFRQELNSRDNILQHEIDGMAYMTTEEMRLAEEKLIELATNGKGKYPALNPDYKPKDWLNTQQRNAVKTILTTSDRSIILRGSAGVGKTTLLTEVKNGVTQAGKSLFAVAPSTQAAKVLADQGFDATTVASLLHNPKLEKLQNQVLLLDEAGLCGLKNTSKILELTEKYNARLIMSGDSRQHSAPAQQDAMRLLETQSKIQTVTVNKIMRQKPEAYKAAIQKLAVGRTMEGYRDLDKKLGAIKEEPDHEKRLSQIAEGYINSISKGRSALIVSPTNYECGILNSVVRAQLKNIGKIKGKERSFDRLINLSLTEAQKQDLVNYSEGLVVKFSKNQKGGFWAGSHHEVMPSKNNQYISIRDLKSGQIQKLPIENTKHFDLFRREKTSLAQGDLIRLTQNIRTDRTKLNNGNTYSVKQLNKNSISLDNGKTIPNDAYHWKHGYTETSHSSQGKTKDDVFISMSDMSFAAVNEQTLYVAASRGKYSATIHTSSKDDLKRAVARSGVRVTAREVAEGHEQRLLQQKQQAHHRALNEKIRENGRIQGREKTATRGISKEFSRH